MTSDARNSTRCSACGGTHSSAEPCPAGEGARVGTVLEGKYEIVRLLGRGGMGEVYEGRHTKIGRRVAVKFLHAEYARHPGVARRFENEAKTAGAVEHENIAAVFDVGVLQDGAQYLVMEFLNGEDLDHVLKRVGRLPLARAVEVLVQACMGLEVVHQRGIVHRDLKPANLFVIKRPNGADLVKVIDFGVAKLRRAEGDPGATKTGVALGTAYYMSPEQAAGEREIGPASDVYALGVILYELLSGQRPHEGDSLLQILHRILTQPPTPLEQVCPGLPPAVYGIVRRAMATNIADRFRGVSELAEALAPFAASAQSPSQPPASPVTHPETAAAFSPTYLSAPPAGRTPSTHVATPGTMVPVGRSAPEIPGIPRRGTAVVVGIALASMLGVGAAGVRLWLRPGPSRTAGGTDGSLPEATTVPDDGGTAMHPPGVVDAGTPLTEADALTECTAGSTRCSGATPLTCSAKGHWIAGQACSYFCSNGACAGNCVPGATQCDGAIPQTCDGHGQWSSGPVAAGKCGATCTPGSSPPQCSGPTPLTCGSTGQWRSGAECVKSSVCRDGVCVHQGPPLQSLSPNCDPNFWIDDQGKHFKPECFK